MSEISRRKFLKIATTSCGGLLWKLPQDSFPVATCQLARVAGSYVNLNKEPTTNSEIISRIARNELIHLYYEISSDQGNNPLWYRTWGGFVHSAYLQVINPSINSVNQTIPAPGRAAQVTVPETQAFIYNPSEGWLPGYHLYYGSVHWIEDVTAGPYEGPSYKIIDSYHRPFFAQAEHLRVILPEEITPLSSGVPDREKWIEVSIPNQMVSAFEGSTLVFQTAISSGVPQRGEVPPGGVPSDTPLGDFHITVKTFCRHMGGTHISNDVETDALPGVPWVSFFHKDGYSFHGTYWHSNFGVRMSHGCVNMRNEDALWLFRWTTPFMSYEERQTSGWGTRVRIIE